MFALLQLILFVGAGMFLNSGGTDNSVANLVVAVFFLGIFIPSLAVTVRRFHDQDRSGWFVLIGIIPYIGSLIVLVFMMLDGTEGENRFGPDPKIAASADFEA